MADTEDNRDAYSARVSPICPPTTQAVLGAAWTHDLPALKLLLDAPGKASCQDPVTGETPLHAVVRSSVADSEKENPAAATAADCMRELFFSGAIWNDVDEHNETPGCVSDRLGRTELYELCVEAGVRAELLFGLLDGYEELSSGEDDDEEMEEVEVVEEGDLEDFEKQLAAVAAANGANSTLQDGDEAPVLVDMGAHVGAEDIEAEAEAEGEEEPTFTPPKLDPNHNVKSEAYLNSKLTYSEGKLVDDAGNGVMMAWETEIMRRSVDALLPGHESGKRILNIGFGMGIIDSMFVATKPARHHIIEAHPEVISHVGSSPASNFGAVWEAGGPEPGAYKIHEGRWQDVVPRLLEAGEIYDAVYFDTFGEDYAQLRNFFTEYIPGLLDERGVFGFFNGLGADRRVCYDVYTRVAEMHLSDAGLDVEWQEIDVDMQGMGEAGKGEWEGVKRRYWTLSKYRLPVCTFMG